MRWLKYHKDFSLQGERTEANSRDVETDNLAAAFANYCAASNESKENCRVTRLILAAMVSFRLD
jgi:hypothetical protein